MIFDKLRRRNNEDAEFVEVIKDSPLSRLALATFHPYAENPESIPRSVFRSKGLATTAEQQIPPEARKLVADEFSRTVAALIRGMPEEVVKEILYPPKEPTRKTVTE